MLDTKTHGNDRQERCKRYSAIFLHIDFRICLVRAICDLTLSTLGKIFSRRHFEIFFLFFSENRIWHFMQIVSYASAQSDQNLQCPHKGTLHPWLSKMRPVYECRAKIKQRRMPGRSESAQFAHVRKHVFAWCDTFDGILDDWLQIYYCAAVDFALTVRDKRLMKTEKKKSRFCKLQIFSWRFKATEPWTSQQTTIFKSSCSWVNKSKSVLISK